MDEDIEEVPDEDCAGFGGGGWGEGDEGYSVRGNEQGDCEAEGEDGDGVREEGRDGDGGFIDDGHGVLEPIKSQLQLRPALRGMRKGESCLTRGSKGP